MAAKENNACSILDTTGAIGRGMGGREIVVCGSRAYRMSVLEAERERGRRLGLSESAIRAGIALYKAPHAAQWYEDRGYDVRTEARDKHERRF